MLQDTESIRRTYSSNVSNVFWVFLPDHPTSSSIREMGIVYKPPSPVTPSTGVCAAEPLRVRLSVPVAIAVSVPVPVPVAAEASASGAGCRAGFEV